MSKRVLVVDDDGDIQRLLSARLKTEGYDVCIAPDGVSCMQQIRNKNPDLILLDLSIPAGDGLVSLDRIRDNHDFEQIPVVILTADTNSQTQALAIDAGANAYLNKSEPIEKLLTTVSRYID